MFRLWKALLIAVLALFTLTPVASGRVIVREGFRFYGGWYSPGWYGPGWYGPYWGPYYRGYYVPAAGQVKIVTKVKGDQIFLDGGFAGLTGKLKQFPLRPGEHEIALRDPNGYTFYQERVQVLMGKTIEIHPDQRG